MNRNDQSQRQAQPEIHKQKAPLKVPPDPVFKNQISPQSQVTVYSEDNINANKSESGVYKIVPIEFNSRDNCLSKSVSKLDSNSHFKPRYKGKGRRQIPANLHKVAKSKHSSESDSDVTEDNFILSMLNKTESHFIADDSSEPEEVRKHVPPGLEVFTSVTSLRVSKREILATSDNQDVFYRAFNQYDIRDRRKSMANIAIALETSNCSSVFWWMDARLFSICMYDYKTDLILRIERRWSCKFCLAKYYLFCLWTGWNGCGNTMEVYDAYDELIGTIKQCTLFTRRLVYMQEYNDDPRNDEKKSMGNPKFTWSQIFCQVSRVWRDLQVKKFDVFNAKGKAEVRIEQYTARGNFFKFIYLEEVFNAGHIRKSGENEYNIELWKYFSEKQKAVLVGASFLMDHVCFQIGIEGTYITKIREDRDKELFRPCYRWFHFNRFRRIQFFILVVVIISLIFYASEFELQ